MRARTINTNKVKGHHVMYVLPICIVCMYSHDILWHYFGNESIRGGMVGNNPARARLNMICFSRLSPFAPENLVSRYRFDRPGLRPSAHSRHPDYCVCVCVYLLNCT